MAQLKHRMSRNESKGPNVLDGRTENASHRYRAYILGFSIHLIEELLHHHNFKLTAKALSREVDEVSDMKSSPRHISIVEKTTPKVFDSFRSYP